MRDRVVEDELTRATAERIARAATFLRQRGYLVIAPDGIRPEQQISVGPFLLDRPSSSLKYGTRQRTFSPIKFLIIEALLEAEGGWCSRRAMRKRLWGDAIPPSDPLAVHVYHLRRELSDLTGVDLLESSRRRGYRIDFSRLDASV